MLSVFFFFLLFTVKLPIAASAKQVGEDFR